MRFAVVVSVPVVVVVVAVELCHGETVCGVHGAKSINVTNARYGPDDDRHPKKEASELRREHLWDAVRFMGLLIGPLPDHKRIFDIHTHTHIYSARARARVYV